MRTRFPPWTAALAVLSLSGCAGFGSRLKLGESKGGEVVEVVGEALVVKEDPAGTKGRSLTDAQKKAVAMVVGVHISEKTRVEQAIQIEQNILAKTEGYIQKYDLLKEWEEGPFYKTKIRALVAHQKVAEDLRAAGLLRKPEVGHPRVAVLLTEHIEGVGDRFEATAGGHAVAQGLLDEGYRVVDRADLLAAKAEEVAHAVERGDASGVPKLGAKLDAEVLVFGNAYGQRIESDMLAGLFSYRVTLNAQAYKAQTNEILLTVGKIASGLDAVKEAAANKALENVGKLVGKDIASRLAAELARRAGVAVTVTGVSDLNRLHDFQSALSALPGVGDYYMRSWGEGKAVIDVELKGVSSQEIARTLERREKLKAKVASVTQDTLAIELQP